MTLVSCIMPTANRRAFVPHAIADFLRQDHAERELVILDDGEDPVGDLISADPRIRYLRETRRRTTGAKRNACVEAAAGEVIVHWDDDDWYAPDRIRRQLAALEAAQADLCGMESLLFFDPAGGEAWLYRYPGRDPAWVCGVSMMYRRDLWRRNAFPNLQVGEDSHFIWNARGLRAVRMGETRLIAAMVHAANTSPRRTEGSCWSPRPIGEVQSLLGEDWRRYAHAEAAPVSRPSPAPRRVVVGVHGAQDAIELAGTLRALRDNGDHAHETVVLGVSTAEQAAAAAFGAAFVSHATLGGARAFNLLVQRPGDIMILLEAGARPARGWLTPLLAAFDDPAVGLAGPSTNRHWSAQGAFDGAFDGAGDTEPAQARAAQVAAARFAGQVTPTAPLHSLGAFCYAVRRQVVDVLGAADEGFGEGPCWEMEYAARAARAGFQSVWAGGSYVHRAAPTPARLAVEERSFQAARERYQDRLCGLRLSGERADYAEHCRGDDCPHFAPPGRIALWQGFEAAPPPHRSTPVPRAEPLVSCVMPTGDRREWALQAIRYFQRQSWGARELVIVDDGREGLEGDLPCDPRIRYIRRDQRMTIGAKRNLACDHARGDYVVLWDDDDWHGPERIARQLAPIRSGRAQLTALQHAPFLEVATGAWWRCAPDLHRRIFLMDVMGGTLAFPRPLFSRGCRFPDASLAEDAAFLRAAVQGGARLEAIGAEDLYVYVRHGANTWRFSMSQGQVGGWSERAAPAAIGEEFGFYAPRAESRA